MTKSNYSIVTSELLQCRKRSLLKTQSVKLFYSLMRFQILHRTAKTESVKRIRKRNSKTEVIKG